MIYSTLIVSLYIVDHIIKYSVVLKLKLKA